MLDSHISSVTEETQNQSFIELNIVARTESRRDTDSSTVKDTAFVVSRTVFITHTALM